MPPHLVVSPAYHIGWPDLDKVPPINSTEVQGWIQDVKNSGVDIPDLSITQPGGCDGNPDVKSDTSRCWWTCGGCARPEDITTCPDKVHPPHSTVARLPI